MGAGLPLRPLLNKPLNRMPGADLEGVNEMEAPHNHPQGETPYLCMKHQIPVCRECLQCRDSNIYCKFRTSCPIHFVIKHGDGAEEQ